MQERQKIIDRLEKQSMMMSMYTTQFQLDSTRRSYNQNDSTDLDRAKTRNLSPM